MGVEGKNLLKQRNALQHVHSAPVAEQKSPAKPAWAQLSLDRPGEDSGLSADRLTSPGLSRKRKSFKDSILRMINGPVARRSGGSEDSTDGDGSLDNAALTRVASLPAVNVEHTPVAERPSSALERERDDEKEKANGKPKKSTKKKKDKEREKGGKKDLASSRTISLPLSANPDVQVSAVDIEDANTSPGTHHKSGVSISVSDTESESADSRQYEYVDVGRDRMKPPTRGQRSISTPLPVANETLASNLKLGKKSASVQMQKSPVGTGSGNGTQMPGKPPRKPKPSISSVAASTSLPSVNSPKPPTAKKPSPVTSRSSSITPTQGPNSTPSGQGGLRKRGASTPGESGNYPVNSAGEATRVSEVGLAGRDSVPLSPEEEDTTMLYQTYQVVSLGTQDKNKLLLPILPGRVSPDSLPARSKTEQVLQRMHTTIHATVNKRPPKSNLRWEDQPKVRNSMALPDLSKEEQMLQQRYFEVLSSEKSYNQSLKVLVSHFMNAEVMVSNQLIDMHTRHLLFSNSKVMLEVSDRLVADLDERLQDNVTVSTVCDILKEHVEKYFDPFVLYCSNQAYQMRTLENLLKVEEVKKAIQELERCKEAQGLPLCSFILLPMQRVTRLKLLVDAIIKTMPPQHDKLALSMECLKALEGCVTRCNEGAKAMKRTEDLIELHHKVDFGKLKPLALVSHQASRWLMRNGNIMYANPEKKNKLCEVHLIVCNDLMLIAKVPRKKSNIFRIIDYGFSAFVAVEKNPAVSITGTAVMAGDALRRSASEGALNKLNDNTPVDVSENKAFQVTLLENSAQENKSYIFQAGSMSEKERWVEALCPESEGSAEERIYESWDCPEVEALYQYLAKEPDELSIEPGDIITVKKKMKDGWYQGHSCRSGETGWFPGTHVEERESAHSRARNLRRQYKLQDSSFA